MILCDLSHITYASILASGQGKLGDNHDAMLMKATVFNLIRQYKLKHKAEFGELVLCCDSRNYWRKDLFEFYKADRAAAKEKSYIDWSFLGSILSEITRDIKENFPYKVIQISKVEADDVIATLCKNIKEKILIISSDEDFMQLQKYTWVQQYSLRAKKFLVNDNPHCLLMRHIIKAGDDGIPNIKSDGDTLINPAKRQPSVFEKELVIWDKLSPEEFCKANPTLKENFERNRKLIDFDLIPQDIQDAIMIEYEIPKIGNHKKLYEYFVKSKLMIMLQHTTEF